MTPTQFTSTFQLWRTLGECSVDAKAAAQQVRTMLERCLPSDVPSAPVRLAIEQAILDAIARRPASADALPLLTIFCLEQSGAADSVGWSFFVMERPALPHADRSALHDRIELCLYYE